MVDEVDQGEDGRCPSGPGCQPSASAASASSQSGIPNAGEGWEWWSGPDDEFYRCGPCSTREIAIAEALSDYDDREQIYVVEAIPQKWCAPSANQVIEYMYENSDDLFSDDYPDPVGTPEQQKACERELQVALNAWMDKWRDLVFPSPTAFAKTRNAACVSNAQAIEARQGGNGEAGAVHESAVAESDAPEARP